MEFQKLQIQVEEKIIDEDSLLHNSIIINTV